ncbi:MAG: glycosyltransferase [Acidimicrobiia bacterium]
MLRLVGYIAQTLLILLVVYNAVTALWGWPQPKHAPKGARRRRFRVVVPAHNEEKVVAGLVADLARQDYPAELVEVWVLADRCTDGTATVARAAGVEVAERSDGPPGKGAALGWYLSQHPLDANETLVVFDADNRIPAGTLGRIADELDAGAQVLQCYLDVTNPDRSSLAEAAALSYWASNRMVQLARARLGWSADLGGTGMAITARALADGGGFGDSLTEDQELGLRLLLAGHPVGWLHDVRIRDEKPAGLASTVRQRARWMAGKRSVRRAYLGRLLRQGTPAAWDMAVRLVQPGRTFVALLSGVLTVVAAVTGSSWLIGWEVWGVLTAIQVLEPIPFLARDGVEPRRLVRYPLLVLLAALWIPIRIVSSRVSGWYHTPHEGTTP